MSVLTLPASAIPANQVPLHFAFLLFPTFQALDVFGPLDALNSLSLLYPDLRLSILSHSLSPVSTLADPSFFLANPANSTNNNTKNDNDKEGYGGPGIKIPTTFEQKIVPTHTYANPPPNIDILLIPGGLGTRAQLTSSWLPVVNFLSTYISRPDITLKGIFSVCTGSALLARALAPGPSSSYPSSTTSNDTTAHLLDGVNATTNKLAFQRIKDECPKVNWIPRARWVRDSITLPSGEVKLWTCSGISAGLDGIFAFIGEEYGEEVADSIAKFLEYVRRTDPNDDPFAVHI